MKFQGRFNMMHQISLKSGSYLATLGLALLLVGCGEPKNVAAEYQKSSAASSASPATTSPSPSASPTPSTGTTGDSAAGLVIIKSSSKCGQCHPNAGGPALNKANASKVTTILADKPAFHTGMKTELTAGSKTLLDITAGMNATP